MASLDLSFIPLGSGGCLSHVDHPWTVGIDPRKTQEKFMIFQDDVMMFQEFGLGGGSKAG